MNLLLDTHLLLWAAGRDRMMSERADSLINDAQNRLWFSAASIWEVAIKSALGRPDFRTDPGVLRSGLLTNGYHELAVEGRHCLALGALPKHHSDPFDRILIAQSVSEGLALVTHDKQVARYSDAILFV